MKGLRDHSWLVAERFHMMITTCTSQGLSITPQWPRKRKKKVTGCSYKCKTLNVNISLNECSSRFIHNSWVYRVRLIELLILTCKATAKKKKCGQTHLLSHWKYNILKKWMCFFATQQQVVCSILCAVCWNVHSNTLDSSEIFRM